VLTSSRVQQPQKQLYPCAAIVLEQIVSKEDSFSLTQIFTPVLQSNTDMLITCPIFYMYNTGIKSLNYLLSHNRMLCIQIMVG
jgi:hypothetical protein